MIHKLLLILILDKGGKIRMVVQNSEALALLGYIIVTNEEMHSYQIRYLNSFLEKEGLIDYKCQIYEVIHDLDEKTSLGSGNQCFREEN